MCARVCGGPDRVEPMYARLRVNLVDTSGGAVCVGVCEILDGIGGGVVLGLERPVWTALVAVVAAASH